MDPTDDDEEDSDFISIKMTLNSILKPQFAEEAKSFFFKRSHTMTEVASLASMLLLHKVNGAFNARADDFFDQNGTHVIMDCFRAVLQTHVDDPNYMPVEFRQTMEQHNPNFNWPRQAILGNGFNYFVQMYITNLRTNLKLHCETRLKYFFRMRIFQINAAFNENFDGIDMRNILKDVLANEDWAEGEPERIRKRNILWQELIAIGFEPDTNIKFYVKDNWFRAIRPFIHMQRIIESFINEPRPPPQQIRRNTIQIRRKCGVAKI